MSLAVVRSLALDGLAAPEVTVEVHLANGLPSFTLVGLADTEVKEARERVRAALASAGLAFPHNKRITVNLAPADLPKESGRFDLPIAVGILAAMGEIPLAHLDGLALAGELSLGGGLRPVRGALAIRGANRDGGEQRWLCRAGLARRPWAVGGQARPGNRRRRRAQPPDGGPAWHGQVDAGAAPAGPAAAAGDRRGAGVGGGAQPLGRLRCRALAPPVGEGAASFGFPGRAGGRRLAAPSG